ncbi:MAG: transglutaminase family protein [Wujia sp.]
MKKLHFNYYMQIDYSFEVEKCNFTIKCFPQSNSRQSIEEYSIDLFPNTKYSWGMDGLKNKQIYGQNIKPHKTFYFNISGKATVGLADYEEIEDDNTSMIFRHPYGLNKAGDNIKAYYKTLEISEDKSNYDRAIEIMHSLYKYLSYLPNSTNVDTTAEEAFSMGNGVCQDYAHIFISLLHLAGIPARYVTGLIIGEGATHAWVEILHEGRWYGLDPTNDVIVRDEHIKIGIGRDAHDCMINRGIMHGVGTHTQKIGVSVEERKEQT